MAKTHHEPRGVVGVGTERLTKHASMDPEQELPPSHGPTKTRNWGNGSYDVWTGRSARVGEKHANTAQVPKAGTHTKSPAAKSPTRPGRW